MDPITLGALNKLNRKINDIQSIPDEKITEAVNTYLDENPVTPGATEEQATQIQNNADGISDIQSKLSVTDEEADNYLFGV